MPEKYFKKTTRDYIITYGAHGICLIPAGRLPFQAISDSWHERRKKLFLKSPCKGTFLVHCIKVCYSCLISHIQLNFCVKVYIFCVYGAVVDLPGL
jgi:hypothetical protein